MKTKKEIHKKSQLLSLRPFMDDEGIIRVGGRIKNAAISLQQRQPTILPKNCLLTKLIINHAHASTLHGGNQITLAYCRRKFWILHGRQAVRQVIRQCPICIRYKGKTMENIMGNLPEPRITPSPPFFNTGVDYAGPFQLRVSKGRGTSRTKDTWQFSYALSLRPYTLK